MTTLTNEMTIQVMVPLSVRQAMVDAEWAWPTGAAVAGWRRLVRLGHAEETTGECEGCRSHAPGHRVPVFHLRSGVDLRVGDGPRSGLR